MSIRTEPKAKKELDPQEQHFVFKSKFKEDKVTLDKGSVETLPNGMKVATGARFADFSRFTFTTDSPDDAETLREFIKQRLKKGNPLHILETTKYLTKASKKE